MARGGSRALLWTSCEERAPGHYGAFTRGLDTSRRVGRQWRGIVGARPRDDGATRPGPIEVRGATGSWMRVMGVLQGSELGPVLPLRKPTTLWRANVHKTTRSTPGASRQHTPWLRFIANITACPSSNDLLRTATSVLSCSLAGPRLAMALGTLPPDFTAADFSSGGTGARFARAIIIVAGVCALVASLVTFV